MAITFEELKKNSETQNKQEPVTFESLQPQEIKEEPKIQPITFESIKKEKEENEIGVGENIYRTAIGALRDVAQGTVDFSSWVESGLPTSIQAGLVKTDEDGYQVLYGDEYVEAKERLKSQGIKSINLPKIEEPTYFGGSFVRDVTGFIIPFSRLKMITPLSKIGKGAEIVARGAVAERLAFSPFEQRLSNLIESNPKLSNPVTKYLKADPEDTESEATFKMALEGVITGGAIEGIISLAKTVKPLFLSKNKPEPKTKTGEPFTIKDQPDSAKEKTISENLQAIAEPLEDVNITSLEAAPGLLGRKWQTMAGKVIDFTSAKFPSYKPLKDLPNQDKYLTLRGLTTGKLEAVKDLSKNVFETFENLKLDEKISVKNFLTKEGTESAIKNVDVLKKAKELRSAIDTVGKSLADAGILSKEVIKQGEGSYLPRLYLKYFGKNSNMGYTKQRKELPQDTKDFLGEIQDVSLLGSRAIEAPMSDIVRHGFFKKIAEDSNWNLKAGLIKFQGKDVSPLWLKDESDRIAREIRDGLRPSKDNKIIKEMDKLIDDANLNISKADLSLYKKIPETKHYGTLRGSYIRKEIADDIIGAGDFASKETSFAKSVLGDGGLLTKGTKLWKMSKVALNPPTQVRNAMSNVILLNLSGVKWKNLPNRLLTAWKDIGKNGVYSQIAKKYGVVNSTFSKQEMIEINKAYLKAKAKATGNAIDKAKYIAGSIGDAAGNAYQFIEILGKTAKIIDDMAKGIDEGTAALNAQKTLFDYSLVPPSVRYLRNAPLGMPFVTFYYKVLPNLLETAIRHPERYAPYIALPYAYHSLLAAYKGVTNEDFDSLKKALPEYLRDGGKALAMPVKDNQGRWQFLDFSYFLPWSAFTGIVKSAADGNVQKFFSNFGLFGAPAAQLVTAALVGKDPFTQREIVNRFDPPAKKIADTMMYIYRMAMPTWLTDIGFAGKLKEVLDKDVNRYGDPKITMTQAMTRLIGVNIYPIDPQKSRATNIKLMKNEITGIKSRRSQVLKDKNLSSEDRKNNMNKYNEMIKERIKQVKEYIKESRIPERLK
jgi:hypothetical protein